MLTNEHEFPFFFHELAIVICYRQTTFSTHIKHEERVTKYNIN